MKKQPLQIYTAKHSAIKYAGVVCFINPLLTDMEEDKEGSDCTVPSEADAVVLRLVLDEKDKSFEDVEELQFNPSVINEDSDPVVVQASLGQRRSHDIKLERYISQVSTNSSLTSDDIPLKELPDNIPYFSGIPAVEAIRGIIHLFRDRSKPVKQRSSKVICILGVPAHLSLTDLLEFLLPVQSWITSIQVVRDSTPNQYMIILRFKDKASAEQFYMSYNMRRYSSLERRVCQLVYASRIEFIKTGGKSSQHNIGLTELPSCPVCLERLDESVLTILCNHSFHTYCLTKWEDSTCPVCRYTQIPEPSGENTCSTCDSKEDLWICLICGHVGCGRYLGGHANDHFLLTQHTFTMQVGTQRVWDYIGDNYVHRLVQNKGDGKLIEVEGQTDLPDDEKIDSLQLEYTYLLTSQLDSQRLYFEEKLERAEKEAAEQISVLNTRCRNISSENEKLGILISELEKEKKERDKKLNQLQTKLSKVHSELQEEKELNKYLSDNQHAWRDRVTALEEKMHSTMDKKDQEIKDLQDQVKDLMFYLETQQKISQAPEGTKQDIQGGHLVVTVSPEASGGGKKGRKKGRHS